MVLSQRKYKNAVKNVNKKRAACGPTLRVRSEAVAVETNAASSAVNKIESGRGISRKTIPFGGKKKKFCAKRTTKIRTIAKDKKTGCKVIKKKIKMNITKKCKISQNQTIRPSFTINKKVPIMNISRKKIPFGGNKKKVFAKHATKIKSRAGDKKIGCKVIKKKIKMDTTKKCKISQNQKKGPSFTIINRVPAMGISRKKIPIGGKNKTACTIRTTKIKFMAGGKTNIYKVPKKNIKMNMKNCKVSQNKPNCNVPDLSEFTSEDLLEQLKHLSDSLVPNLELIKAIASRLYLNMYTNDRGTKERIVEKLRRGNRELYPMFLRLVKTAPNLRSISNVIGLFYESLKSNHSVHNATNSINLLIDLDATSIVIASLKRHKMVYLSETIVQLVWLLGQMSWRDAHFVSRICKFKSTGVKTLHKVLKVHQVENNSIFLPLLQCHKTLTKSAYLVNILVQDNVNCTLGTLLTSVGPWISVKLKLLLTFVSNLTVNNVFIKQITKRGGIITHLLFVFERWMRINQKRKYKQIQRYHELCHLVLSILLKVVTVSRRARSFVCCRMLQCFCLSLPDNVSHYSMINMVFSIVNICSGNNSLLEMNAASPVTFDLPFIDSATLTTSDEDSDFDLELNSIKNKTKFVIQNPKSTSEQKTQNKVFIENNSHQSSMNTMSKYLINQSNSNLRVFQGIHPSTKLDQVYQIISNRINSVVNRVKLGYPDLFLSTSEPTQNCREPLHKRNMVNIKNKMIACIDRLVHQKNALDNVVYDYDVLLETSTRGLIISNHDVSRLGVKEHGNSKVLRFESRFESGNLRKAVQTGSHEYDLILMPDVNSTHHHQWYYFEVSNMDSEASYMFNIINLVKHDSQYEYGMMPLMFSVKESECGRGGWMRIGSDIFYYRNNYVSNRDEQYLDKKTSNANDKNMREFYYTLSFTIKFEHSLDICYFAYHYPYTYSYLLTNIWNLTKRFNPDTVYFRCESLCDSLNQNQIPLITITASDNKIEDRELIVLTSRVHPGESNSSWLIDGIIKFLTGDEKTATKLWKTYVFKIVPMLNVEGVVNGCHRCGLSNEDLNRKWKSPHPVLHPEIFHTKGLIAFYSDVLKRSPYLYCDFHGHSLKKNIFLYGCSPNKSCLPGDKDLIENEAEFSILSRLLEQCSLIFDPKSSHYKIHQSKESTARITIWREFGVTRSYTMESTYCGFDTGSFKDNHININHLLDMGTSVCIALSALYDETKCIFEFNRSQGKAELSFKSDMNDNGADLDMIADTVQLSKPLAE